MDTTQPDASLDDALLRAAFDNAAIPMGLLTLEGRFFRVNPAATAMLGYSQEEFLDMSPLDFHLPEDRAAARGRFRALVRGEFPSFSAEARLTHRDGHTLWAGINVSLCRDAAGQPRFIVGQVEDITERKRLEENERAQRILAETLRDTASALTSTLDTEEVLDRILDGLERVLDYDRASVWIERGGALCPARHRGWSKSDPESAERLARLTIPLESVETLRELARTERARLSDDMQVDPDVLAVGAAQLMPEIHANALAPIRVEGEFIGFLSMSKTEIGFFSEPDAKTLESFADQVAIAIRNARLYEAAARQQEELQRLSLRVVEALEEERWRLARELHDQIGQNLNALGLELNLLRTEVADSDPAAIGRRLEDAIAQLKQTSGHLRSVMTDLRPAVLDDYGLDAALRTYGGDFADRFGLELEMHSSVAGERPDRAVETALFRVAQEALTNVARHADAGAVTVSLEADAETVRLEIADDGSGFDPEARVVDQPERPPWGLLIMRERLQAVGGTLRVDSAPGKGTRVVAEVARSQ